jgi:cold shock CspA family protein/ribosome-associated translation inhibitor RaiA
MIEAIMQAPAQIDFRGIKPSASIREKIEAHIAGLERRFGRLTGCRVVLEGPGEHHRTGGLYDVNIQLALPDGRAVEVGRTATADERYADIDFAINNAFRRARRRLQDQVRRLQGQVKTHEAQPIGIVKRLDPGGEFGFLETPDGREIYFHKNSVLNGAFSSLTLGTHVGFFEEMGERGPQASTLRVVGKHGMR